MGLKEVCRGPIPVRSLDSSKILNVKRVHRLKILFSFSLARSGLSQLEEMTIGDCSEMQQVIMAYESRESELTTEDDDDDHVGINLLSFPKLQSLKLDSLPKLTNLAYFSCESETTSQGMCAQGNVDHIILPFFSDQVCSVFLFHPVYLRTS